MSDPTAMYAADMSRLAMACVTAATHIHGDDQLTVLVAGCDDAGALAFAVSLHAGAIVEYVAARLGVPVDAVLAEVGEVVAIICAELEDGTVPL